MVSGWCHLIATEFCAAVVITGLSRYHDFNITRSKTSSHTRGREDGTTEQHYLVDKNPDSVWPYSACG